MALWFDEYHSTIFCFTVLLRHELRKRRKLLNLSIFKQVESSMSVLIYNIAGFLNDILTFHLPSPVGGFLT